MSEPARAFPIVVHGVLMRDGLLGPEVLLGRRINTKYGDGEYAFPCGHIEPFETQEMALRRELKEEIGVTPVFSIFNRIARKMTEPNLLIEHILDSAPGTDHPDRFRHYVSYFFALDKWKGTPRNLEPHLCEDLNFFPLQRLPQPVMQLTSHALDCLQQGQHYSRLGWDDPEFVKWSRRHTLAAPAKKMGG